MTQYEYLIDSITRHGDKDECLLWPYPLGKRGYGRIQVNKKRFHIHRVSLKHKLGREIPPDMYACHTCRNKHCYAMAHVYEGTPEQNCFDKIADDTNEHGIRNGCHVLVDQQVIEIREKYATGLFSQNELAREYGVRQSQIWKIIRRRNWKHL